MAVAAHKPITKFEDWYDEYGIDTRTGGLEFRTVSDHGNRLWRMWEEYKREMDLRVANYHKLEALVDGEVISPKPDLPNISSGETAGLVRRIARNLVQNAPNVEVISLFDDDTPEGVFVKHVLTSKIIGSDQYSNDMQQCLFSSTKTALTLGFDCVIPVLQQDAGGGWYMKYDTIHYRDVFPEPGAKDVREAKNVFVRRYLTEGEAHYLAKHTPHGWDQLALRALVQNRPRPRERQSVDKQTAKHHQIPNGYEIITWYNCTGEPFLTFEASTKMLLRIEQNKHPLKQHPVHFLVLEKDALQPFGKSQVELLVGRQDFQDLMLNGAMKLWYRNINPSIIGYGAVNSIPNLSPGKYTQISNPNAKIEPFEVNTQTLMQFGQISEQNLGSMVNLVGNADQQMAASGGNSQGMSATPQGVEAQAQMVDITTNNYQKAIEGFFSHYCSYALTVYFAELKAVKTLRPTAEARIRLVKSGFSSENIKEDGSIDMPFEKLATEYWVRCIPGSLVELEDEKQMRLLNQIFIPLSQAMPALGAAQDPEMLKQASIAMQYILKKTIELSGSADAQQVSRLLMGGDTSDIQVAEQKLAALEATIGGVSEMVDEEFTTQSNSVQQLQDQITVIREVQQEILGKIGIARPEPVMEPNSSEEPPLTPSLEAVT